MKRYYLRYSESRRDFLVINQPHYQMRTSFNEGLAVSRFGGYSTKKSAVEWAAKINAAAGKEIATYAGAFEPPKDYRESINIS